MSSNYLLTLTSKPFEWRLSPREDRARSMRDASAGNADFWLANKDLSVVGVLVKCVRDVQTRSLANAQKRIGPRLEP